MKNISISVADVEDLTVVIECILIMISNASPMREENLSTIMKLNLVFTDTSSL